MQRRALIHAALATTATGFGASFQQAEVAKWAQVIKVAGIKAE